MKACRPSAYGFLLLHENRHLQQKRQRVAESPTPVDLVVPTLGILHPAKLTAQRIALRDERVAHAPGIVQCDRTLAPADIQVDAPCNMHGSLEGGKNAPASEPQRGAQHTDESESRRIAQ